MSFVIVDYGMGNHASLVNALRRLGADPVVTADHGAIAGASRLILPGVGAFAAAMAQIDRLALRAPLVEFSKSSKPMLGICLGMQLMFERGDEGGPVAGLGIFKGAVEKIIAKDLKIPHVGFDNLEVTNRGTLLEGVIADPDFYFTHSFAAKGTDDSEVTSYCNYGERFVASVQRGRVMATQFHPELSQKNGLTLLRNFLGA